MVAIGAGSAAAISAPRALALPTASPAPARPIEAADPPPARPGTRVAYDVFHPRPWGWKVALYLWTKGIGAGAFGVVFLAATLGLAPVDQLTRVVVATISLAGVGLTALLLVADLKRPERFLSILYRPQRRSWLAIGAFILTGYSGLLGLWWLGTILGVDDRLLTVARLADLRAGRDDGPVHDVPAPAMRGPRPVAAAGDRRGPHRPGRRCWARRRSSRRAAVLGVRPRR